MYLAVQSVKKGIDCILATQVKVKGKLTAWAAQYDKQTLKPAKARAFELVSLCSAESVGITEFLMRLPHPSDQIKKSIQAAVEWLDQVKIPGYKFVDINDDKQPNGKDRVLIKQEGISHGPGFIPLKPMNHYLAEEIVRLKKQWPK